MITHRTKMRAVSVVAGLGIVALLATGCARGGDSGSPTESGGAAAASPGITHDTTTLGITPPPTAPLIATVFPTSCVQFVVCPLEPE